MTVLTSAEDIAREIQSRIEQISQANGYETDIGARVFRGQINVNDGDVPCVSIIEGTDNVQSQPGRSALWKIDQHYALVGYAPCDPAHPNDAAHKVIRDIKRVIFKTDGKADARFGGAAIEVHYRGRNIAPRADGIAVVMAVVEISVTYAESLP